MIKNNKDKKPIETTGHEWDGVSEYNIPAPRWWLITWIICIIWAVGYWFFYPTWPVKGGNTKGSLNWTQKSELAESQLEIENRKNVYLEKFSKSNFEEIFKDKQLTAFALNGGRAAFKENCAACHGTGAQGGKGFPNLNDDDWLWGGKIDDIYTTLKYGIRSSHEKSRASQMPSFGLDKILKKEEIESVVEYVMSLSGKAEANAKGEEIFKANCVVCHSVGGKGGRSFGAPNLSDAIWLYGGSKEDITYTINYAYAGVMPYWEGRLDEQTIKQLSIYVHSLGGGEK
jgi:cytochrome c oxidase cbb3-type subunit 3